MNDLQANDAAEIARSISKDFVNTLQSTTRRNIHPKYC